jgi:hypothetical protein
MHPSRSRQLLQATSSIEPSAADEENPRHTKRPSRRRLTETERRAQAEEHRREKEQNQKERERKIKQREKKRRDLRKMTSKGQPLMKPRLESLLSKVKKVMKSG